MRKDPRKKNGVKGEKNAANYWPLDGATKN